jgi:hypothetical protein
VQPVAAAATLSRPIPATAGEELRQANTVTPHICFLSNPKKSSYCLDQSRAVDNMTGKKK